MNDDDRKKNGLLNADEAAAILGVSTMTVSRLVRDGELSVSVRTGLRRKRRLYARNAVVALKKKYAN